MSDNIKSIELINEQWKEAQDFFRSGEYNYTSYEKLKELDFFHWMFQVLEQAVPTLIIEPTVIKSLYRAANEKQCDYDRFVPKWKYASDNRMNGDDKLYYYFGVSYKGSKREAVRTCLEEIRELDNDVAICRFQFVGDINELKIIDFIIEESIPDTNEEALKYLHKQIRKYEKVLGIESASMRAVAKFIIKTFNDSSAFEPIDKDNISAEELRYKYISFWAITDYLESKGYDGLLFSSTVDNGGKNLVLFDIDKASYIDGTLEFFNSKDFRNMRS